MSEANDSKLDSLIRHLDGGGQIANAVHCIYRVKEDWYFLSCCNDGCCDTDMTKEDLLDWLEEDYDDYEALSNVKHEPRGSKE